MGINKKIVKRQVEIPVDGQVAVTVGGLTPNQLATILKTAGEDIAGVVGIADDLDAMKMEMKGKDNEMIAEIIANQVPTIMSSVAKNLPEMFARIIAVAADDEDEWEFVLNNFNIGLQVECLQKIAELSFNGPQGFQIFLGNVLALVDTGRTLTSAPSLSTHARKRSGGGSKASSSLPN